jgi:hypothetical protein
MAFGKLTKVVHQNLNIWPMLVTQELLSVQTDSSSTA